MKENTHLRNRFASAAILALLPILSPGSAEGAGAAPVLEVRAWLYDTQNTGDRSDDVAVNPEGSELDYYVETNVDATQGLSSPARLYSGNEIWHVNCDGSTIYRLIFQFQADSANLKYDCDIEGDAYWFVQNSDGYWASADAGETKELLSSQRVANEDIADASGVGSTSADYRIAQSFMAKGDAFSVQIYGRETTSTLASAILRIETDNSGEPSGTLVSSDAVDTLPSSGFGTSYDWVTFTFDSPIPLQADTTYHLVLRDNLSVDSVPVCQATGMQQAPEIASDGYHGAIVTWEDQRGISSTIYAQRVDSSGDLKWTTDGELVCNTITPQYDPEIVTDDHHGAIITWYEYRGSDADVFAQRVDSSGSKLWGANGVTISAETSNQIGPRIVSDGYHGAIIVWYDYRNSGLTEYDIYAQRVDSLGSVLWAANGEAVCQADSTQDSPQIVSDGHHGAIITWRDERPGSSEYDIYAQRVDSSGNMLWAADGVPVCTSQYMQQDPMIVSDGHNGAIITWRDGRTGVLDIYAQRVDSLGNMKWTADGVAVCAASGGQQLAEIASDGYHGAIIAWRDYRGSTYDIYAQRVDSSGNMKWTTDGVVVSQAAGTQTRPKIVSDGDHGAIITWEDGRGGEEDIYAQRVDPSGNMLWTTGGVGICQAGNSQYHPKIAIDGYEGAFITWYDVRGIDYDIYAEGIDSLGNLKWGGCFEWAYEAADYADGEMLDRPSADSSWTHHDSLDLFFRFPAWLITDYRTGWWSDPTDTSHQHVPDVMNDITKIDTDDRLECVDATRNWENDAYNNNTILVGNSDQTLVWETHFIVDEDWQADNDSINVQLHMNSGGGGQTTDILFKLGAASSKLKWKYPASGSIGAVLSSPAIRGGRVYVGSDDGYLYCINASDGSLIWSYWTSGFLIRSSPAAAYESGNWVLYFGADHGTVYAVKDTGSSYEVKWTKTLGPVVGSSPALWDSLLYVGCDDDSIHCLRTSDGSQKWAAYLYGDISSSPAVFDDVVYIGSKSDTLYALNHLDGTILRKYDACGDIVAPVFITWATGKLCIGSYASETAGSDTLYVIDSSNFSDYWKFADSGNLARTYTSCFSLDNCNVYFGNDNDCLYCIDLSDSSLVYKHQTGGDVKSSPLYWNEVVYFGSNDDKFYALDNLTQQPKSGWPFIANDDIQSSPAVSLSSSIVVVGASDGHLYAFELE